MSFKIGQVASPAVRAPFAPIKSRAHLCSIPTVDIIRSPVRVIGKRPKMSDRHRTIWKPSEDRLDQICRHPCPEIQSQIKNEKNLASDLTDFYKTTEACARLSIRLLNYKLSE